MPSVFVLDYGSGNIRSVQRALERVGAEVTVSDKVWLADEADGLVVPGVGAFAACIVGMSKIYGPAMIAERVAAGRPVLGICVGMQTLFEAGTEHGVRTAGMGLLTGEVQRLDAPVLPHMGWNTVDVQPGSRLFAGLPADTRYYFVHSYAAPAAPGLAHRTTYGRPFVAAVEDGALSATQFHPEKSGDAGAHLLENWIKSL